MNTAHTIFARHRRGSRAVSWAACVAIIAVAAAALAGWWLDIAALRSWVPAFVGMNPVTAITFLVVAVALLAIIAQPVVGRNSRLRNVAIPRLFASLALLLPLLCSSRHFLPWDLGPDRLLFRARVAIPLRGFANRMAPVTAIAFVLVGMSLLLLTSRSRTMRRIALGIATLTGVIALVVVVDYAYAASLVTVPGFIPVALNTAVAFIACTIGLHCARPSDGLASLFLSPRVGSRLAWRLLPAALVIPLLIGWAELGGEHAGWFDGTAGDAIVSIATALILAGFVLKIARSLDRTDRARTLAEQQVRDLNLHLEARVIERTRELRATEEQVRQTEEQLRQSQKLEAVGRLAGGVAHDFNNILMVIQSASDFVLDDLDAADPRREDVLDIAAAAKRAATLTRQLLAFSRQQVLNLRVLDVNEVVEAIEPMLRRLIEVNIELVVRPGPGVQLVKADSGQLDQILLNLVVNARDAMAAGGTIIVETADVVLSDDFPQGHLAARPGPHVMLSVTDTGAGMDAETQRRIFEPFFTTKALGHGTGLGLATVYGIVKQFGGHIWVYSEPGHGTTFKIYLPTSADEAAPIDVPSSPHSGNMLGATVLVVEDEHPVRASIRRMLERQHYRVIEACNGAEALELLDRRHDSIDLVLSDMVMPGMSGLELSDQLAHDETAPPVLLMSGYSAEAIARLGTLQTSAPVIEKPFAAETLMRRIDEVLASATTS